MSKTIQRPLTCRNANCGAMCYPAQAEDMFTFCGGNPNKCFNYERRDDLYRQTELLDKTKKAREQMLDSKFDGKTVLTYNDAINDCVKILDKLIESEE